MTTNNSDFNKYLLAEYQNIAEAHFRTIAAISSFFQYYITIMALPVALFSLLVSLTSKQEINSTLLYFVPILSMIFLVISCVGFFVLLYIINLRMDAILYARTVNGIRRYFYDNSHINVEDKTMIQVLPQNPFLPSYWEGRYFLPVVISFALFNTFYLGSGIYYLIFLLLPNIISYLIWIIILVTILFFTAHIIVYYRLATYRENAYLKSNIIGIDIDGVLNKHREHFCALLHDIVGKICDPDKIKIIPVHEDPELDISYEDEQKIFNDYRYWFQMPCLNNAANVIKKLKCKLGFRIYLYTLRPYPSKDIQQKEEYKKWKDAAYQMRINYPFNTNNIKYYYCSEDITNPINIITKCWLKQNNFEYDKLTIEQSDENTFTHKALINRFNRKNVFKIFIEDDLVNANKLAYMCDIIFLMDQPYNRIGYLHKNIIRVKSWEEIYKWIQKLT